MKKRKTLMTVTGSILVGILIGLGVPPQIASTVGPTVNESAWEMFEDGDEASRPEE